MFLLRLCLPLTVLSPLRSTGNVATHGVLRTLFKVSAAAVVMVTEMESRLIAGGLLDDGGSLAGLINLMGLISGASSQHFC